MSKLIWDNTIGRSYAELAQADACKVPSATASSDRDLRHLSAQLVRYMELFCEGCEKRHLDAVSAGICILLLFLLL